MRVREKILVVEDNPATLRMCAATLEAMGYIPVLATGWLEAVQKVGTDIKMVFTDYCMPHWTGVDVRDMIRQKLGKSVPVVLLTALDNEHLENDLKKFDLVIRKPFTFQEMSDALAHFLPIKN